LSVLSSTKRVSNVLCRATLQLPRPWLILVWLLASGLMQHFNGLQ